MWRLALALSVAISCGTSPEVNIHLQLEGTCESAALQPTNVLSVALLGINDSGEPCAVARRCVFAVEVASVAEVLEELTEVNQPLIDVSDPDAHTLVVAGHRQSCFSDDDQVVCGAADLRDIDADGVLALEMSCGSCESRELLFCP